MPPVQLSPVDQVVIVIYLLAMLGVGLRTGRGDGSSESWFLAGRGLTLPAFVATLVATWYGGILGVGEMAHGSGLAMLTTLAFPYYLFAVIFALWLAPRIRRSGLYTIPDKLAEAYGRPAGLLAALFVWLMANPAPYVLMTGQLLAMSFGLPLVPCLLLGLVLSTVYVYTGGFRADVRVNIAQFLLMFVGFAIMTGFCLAKSPPSEAFARLPEQHLTLSGGQPTGYLLAWCFVALWTFVDPGFHQRCYAAATPDVARRGMLVSVLFWMLFDAMTVTCGLYAKVFAPTIPPIEAYPRLGELVLPPVLLGLFFVGMLATVMSTLVSYSFLCGVTFARDVRWRLRGGAPDDDVTQHSAIGLGLTSAIALILAIAVPSVLGLWYYLGTTFVPGLLLPLLLAYRTPCRLGRAPAFAAMLLSSGLSLAWLGLGVANPGEAGPQYPLGWQPLFPGLILSVLICGVGLLFGPREG